MELISICKKLIAVDSARGTDRTALVNELFEICKTLHLSSTVVEIDGRPVYFVAYKNHLAPQLALMSQLETVEHSPASHWKNTGFNPLLPTIKENRLYGLGATTGKADFAAKLKALSTCRADGVVAIGCLEQPVKKHEIETLWIRLGSKPKHVLMGAPSELHRIDWSAREMKLIITIPRSQNESQWVTEQLLRENTVTQTRFFSGKEWLPRMKAYIDVLPQGTALLNLATTCNDFGYAVDGEIEIDLSVEMHPSSLKWVQSVLELLLKLESDLINETDSRFALGLGSLNASETAIEMEVVLQSSQTASKPVFRNYLDQIQRNLEECHGSIVLKEFMPMFQFSAEAKFVEAVDRFVVGVRSEKYQFRHHGFDGVDVVAVGPGSSDLGQMVESVPYEQIERASEIYRSVGERILQ